MSENKEHKTFSKFLFPPTKSKWFLPHQYAPKKALGYGAFGEVMLCQDRETKKMVAIKRVMNVFASWEDGLGEIREMKAMMHCQHSKIMTLASILPPYRSTSNGGVEIDTEFNDIYMVMPAKSYNLLTVMDTMAEQLTETRIRWIMFQMLDGVSYLHRCGILHRDLKPENVLVDNALDLDIIDLGLAREVSTAQYQSRMTEYVMTRWYRAPEVIVHPNGTYNTAVDVWSCGCILAELMMQDAIFPGETEAETMANIQAVVPDPDGYLQGPDNGPASLMTYFEEKGISDRFSSGLFDLLGKLLTPNPASRPKAGDLLDHKVFSSFGPYRSRAVPSIFKFTKPQAPDTFEEQIDLLRDIVWDSMRHFNPELPEVRAP